MSNDKKHTNIPVPNTERSSRTLDDVNTGVGKSEYGDHSHSNRRTEVVNTLPPPPPMPKRNGNNDGNT